MANTVQRVAAIASQLKEKVVSYAPHGSSFADVQQAPPDAILGLNTLYKADLDPNKINLGVGAYRDEDGKPWVLPVVKKTELDIVNNPETNHEYLPIDGLKLFTDASAKLILGSESKAILSNRYVACQTISGTGAVRLGADFLARFRKAPVYISNPTWANHRNIFADAGMDVREYPYWNPSIRGLALKEMLETLQSAPSGSIILLHPCAHNPTGVDPTQEEWRQIAQVMKTKNHFPFFDTAYQGFATGDLSRDASAVRFFEEEGFEMVISQSYSKNLGLYGERVGCLVAVIRDKEQVGKVHSQLCRLSRATISNPPAFGARIVANILNSPDLFREWTVELSTMSNRIIHMRNMLRDQLVQLNTPGSWNHITDQIGMFSYTGLTVAQVTALKDQHHIYMTSNGRISMAGLNEKNIERFAKAVDWAVRNI